MYMYMDGRDEGYTRAYYITVQNSTSTAKPAVTAPRLAFKFILPVADSFVQFPLHKDQLIINNSNNHLSLLQY